MSFWPMITQGAEGIEPDGVRFVARVFLGRDL